MRTTLTIDDKVLAAARGRAQRRGISLGKAVSELAALGYEHEAAPVSTIVGFPMIPAVQDHVITPDMVEGALADE